MNKPLDLVLALRGRDAVEEADYLYKLAAEEIERLRKLLAEALRASDEHPDGPMLNSETRVAIEKILGGRK